MISKDTEKEDVLKLAHPCRCRACTVGCLHGSGALADEDVPKLAKFLKISEKKLRDEFLEEVEKFNTRKFRPKVLRKGKPYGRCIFYDEGKGCTVHEAKPLECAIAMGCKPYGEELSTWFTVNQFVDPHDAESVRQYSAYIKSGGKTIKGAELKDIVPDEKRLKKILSYEILK